MSDNKELRKQLRQRRERWQLVQSGMFDAIGLIVPIAAPLVPAFLTATAIIHYYPALLGIDEGWVIFIAIVAGVVVEMLGILSIETMFEMRTYNATLQDGEESAPFGYAAGAVGFYLALVLMLVVFLKMRPEWALWSLIPLTILGFVTSWVMVLRKQHAERTYKREATENNSDELQKTLGDAQTKLDESLNKSNELQTELDKSLKRLDHSLKESEQLRTELDGLKKELDGFGLDSVLGRLDDGKREKLVKLIDIVRSERIQSANDLVKLEHFNKTDAYALWPIACATRIIYQNGDGAFHVRG